ncbi:MAG: hypothetical protein OEU26_13725 [Candidatus Tectomicrobia bacterium]|nr:hypothetical protein [Candidatus Tectomicrobia bacterium]
MQLPFSRKPNRTIMDVYERLHDYIYALLPPNDEGERQPTGNRPWQ